MKTHIINPSDLLRETIFIRPLLGSETGHYLSVLQKNEYGKHELIGKIYRDQDKYTGKQIYSARNHSGKEIFKGVNDISVIKKWYREQEKGHVKSLPENQDFARDLREFELNRIRQRKIAKVFEQAMER